MRSIQKKFMIPVICAALAGVLAIGVNSINPIFAYLTDNGESTNVLSVGSNEISVVETFNPSTPETGTNTYTKTVNIKNTGTVPCYIRVFLEFSSDKVRGESTVSADGTNYYSLSDFRTEHLPTGWVYVDTGDLGPYYYYTQPVSPNASTSNLLHSFKTTFATDLDIEDFDIYVYAESIQTLNNNGKEFTGTDPWRQAWTEYLS